MRIIMVFFLFTFIQIRLFPQAKASSLPFQAGEKLRYVVSYNWFVLWTEVGEIEFRVNQGKVNNQSCLHLAGAGKSYPFWDVFFNVRDLYQSWVHPQSLLPYAFRREVNEGGYMMDIKYSFQRKKHVAYTEVEKTNHPLSYDTLAISDSTFDVLSVIFNARKQDYTNCRVNDTLWNEILLDNKIYNVHYVFKGKENIKVKGIGKFRCLHFSVGLISGVMFDKGQMLDLWITDDKNKLPVLIESPIIVGTVKARLISYERVKHPLNAKID